MDAQVGTIGEHRIRAKSVATSFAKCLIILFAVTLFTRIGEFNNPLGHVDDQFYLFTGNAMLHGELPYVDVWDRKPIGLFLIYAAIAALGGDGAIVYHLVGACAVLATGLVVFALAKRFTTPAGGLRAGIAYIVLMPTIGGGGGQSPVFYNLLIALAALLSFDGFVQGARRWPRALGAMALVGLAIQVKPTTVFEGAFFGLLFLIAEWRATRRPGAVGTLAIAMIVTAIAPTALAFGAYALIGHAQEMWFATVVSIFLRNPLSWAERLGDVPQMLLFLTVPALATFSALVTLYRQTLWSNRSIFLVGWIAAALVGFVSVPNFFNHYALPLILPMTVAMAALLADRRDGLIFTTMIVLLPILFEAPSPAGILHNREGFDRTAAFVKSNLHGGCLYIYYGPTQFYTATNSCHLSPYVFPDHLETEVEATALTVSPESEIERIFASAPTVVMTGHRRKLARNNRTAAILEHHLWCDYQLARKVPAGLGRTLDIWTRKPKAAPVCPAAHPSLGIIQLTND